MALGSHPVLHRHCCFESTIDIEPLLDNHAETLAQKRNMAGTPQLIIKGDKRQKILLCQKKIMGT